MDSTEAWKFTKSKTCLDSRWQYNPISTVLEPVYAGGGGGGGGGGTQLKSLHKGNSHLLGWWPVWFLSHPPQRTSPGRHWCWSAQSSTSINQTSEYFNPEHGALIHREQASADFLHCKTLTELTSVKQEPTHRSSLSLTHTHTHTLPLSLSDTHTHSFSHTHTHFF